MRWSDPANRPNDEIGFWFSEKAERGMLFCLGLMKTLLTQNRATIILDALVPI